MAQAHVPPNDSSKALAFDTNSAGLLIPWICSNIGPAQDKNSAWRAISMLLRCLYGGEVWGGGEGGGGEQRRRRGGCDQA